jgi:voltage-gated potassium channel
LKIKNSIKEFLDKKNRDEEEDTRDLFLNNELYFELRHLRLPFIITVLTMLIGSLGYIIIDDFSLLDAIYQTGITFTTVGFGEIAPISTLGRFFTITLIITGFAVFTLAVGSVVNLMSNGKIIHIVKVRSMLYRVSRLKNHFVIYYFNDYTLEIARNLKNNHIPFLIVDPRSDLEEIAEEHKLPYYLQAEPHTELSLLRANLSSAKSVITLSDNENDNIAIIASVRLFEKEHREGRPFHILTSAKKNKSVEKLKKLGADAVVVPTKLTGQRISAMAISPDLENLLEHFLYSDNNILDMQEIFVPKYSWMVLKRISEIKIRTNINVTIVGLRRKEGEFIPMPTRNTLITAESTILVIGDIEGLSLAKKFVDRIEPPKMV